MAKHPAVRDRKAVALLVLSVQAMVMIAALSAICLGVTVLPYWLTAVGVVTLIVSLVDAVIKEKCEHGRLMEKLARESDQSEKMEVYSFKDAEVRGGERGLIPRLIAEAADYTGMEILLAIRESSDPSASDPASGLIREQESVITLEGEFYRTKPRAAEFAVAHELAHIMFGMGMAEDRLKRIMRVLSTTSAVFAAVWATLILGYATFLANTEPVTFLPAFLVYWLLAFLVLFLHSIALHAEEHMADSVAASLAGGKDAAIMSLIMFGGHPGWLFSHPGLAARARYIMGR